MRDDGAREYEFVENSGIYHVVKADAFRRPHYLPGKYVRSLCGRERLVRKTVMRDDSMRVCAFCSLYDEMSAMMPLPNRLGGDDAGAL